MIQTTNTNVTVLETAPAKKIRIADEAKALGMLYGLIYTNPKLAALREYVTNARDTHLQHKVDKPVTILMSAGEFIVRDYGPGMSVKELEDKFLACCSTTKDNTNSQYGTFGIGALAALAYADSFEVVSMHAGKKFTCSIHKSDGAPVYSISEDGEWADGSGIEVRVPIEDNDDLREFIDIAVTIQATCGMFDKNEAVRLFLDNKTHLSYRYVYTGEKMDARISRDPGAMRTQAAMESVALQDGFSLQKMYRSVRDNYAKVDKWLNECEEYDAGLIDTMPPLPGLGTFASLCKVNSHVIIPGAAVDLYGHAELMCASLTLHDDCAYDGNAIIEMPSVKYKFRSLMYLAPVGSLTYSPSREGVIQDGKLDALLARAEQRVTRFLNGLLAAFTAYRVKDNNMPKCPAGMFAPAHSELINLKNALDRAYSAKLDGKWCNGVKACLPAQSCCCPIFRLNKSLSGSVSVRDGNNRFDWWHTDRVSTVIVKGIDTSCRKDMLDELRKVKHALCETSYIHHFDVAVANSNVIATISDLQHGCDWWANIMDIGDLRKRQAEIDEENKELRRENSKNTARVTKASPARRIYGFPATGNNRMELGDPISLESVSTGAAMNTLTGNHKFTNTLVVSRAAVDSCLRRQQQEGVPDRETKFGSLLYRLLYHSDNRDAAGIRHVCVVPANRLDDAAALDNVVTLDKLAKELVGRLQEAFTYNNICVMHPDTFDYLYSMFGIPNADQRRIGRVLAENFGKAAATMPKNVFDTCCYSGSGMSMLIGDTPHPDYLHDIAAALLATIGMGLPPVHRYLGWVEETRKGAMEPSGKNLEDAMAILGFASLPYRHRVNMSSAAQAKVEKARERLALSVQRTLEKFSVPFNIKKVRKGVLDFTKRKIEEERKAEAERLEALRAKETKTKQQ